MRYPVVEAIHGVGFAGVVHSWGLTPFTPFLCLFFFFMTVLAFIDWDHQVLPDVITLPGIAIGLVSTLVSGALVTWKDAALASALGYGGFFLIARSYARLRGVEGLGQGDWKLSAMMGAFLGSRRLLLIVFLGSLSGMIYGLVQVLRIRLANGSEVPTDPGLDESETPVPRDRAKEASSIESTGEDASFSDPDARRDEAPQDARSIGRYRLPFGTFLAGSAIFVLFFGDRVLDWYSGFFPF